VIPIPQSRLIPLRELHRHDRVVKQMSNHNFPFDNCQFAKSLKPVSFRQGVEGAGRFIQNI